ncbi:MAG TPA: hypothetical protein VKZ79_14425 [Alphaproteobacteria bacterium]|nr:hypothetical protein [Alphaproteobacteria bacterium]
MSATALDEARPRSKPAARPPLWLLPVIALIAIQASEIVKLHGELFAGIGDPDTLMRLARIKDALAGHGWQGGAFARDNAPYGMVLHWSILFDLPIVALAAILSLVMPFATALSVAGAFTGPLLAYAILWAAWWIPRPVLSTRGRELACFVVLLSPPIIAYGAVGRANHHVALALAAMMIAGLVLRSWLDPRRLAPPIAGGVAAAVALWLSFELVAMAIFPALIVLGLLWVRDGGERFRQNLVFAGSFAVASSAALAIDPPHGGMAVFVLDRLSAPYVAFAWATVAMWMGLGLVDRYRRMGSRRSRAAAIVLAGATAATALILAYPGILGGVNGSIDPLVQRELNAKVEETQPVWTGFKQFMEFGYVGCLGLIAALMLVWDGRRRTNAFAWTVLGVLAAVWTGLGLAHVRFTPYPDIAAAFLLAALVEQAQATRQGSAARYIRAIVLALGLIVPLLAIFLPDTDESAAAEGREPCSVYAVRNALSDPAWYGRKAGIIATDPGSAPALLYWTRHGTVFGPYHRNAQGLRDLLALFRDTGDAAAQGIVAARGIDGFLVCASEPANIFMTADGEAPKAGNPAPDTLYKRLVEGHPPAWLERRAWPAGMKSGYVLYRVISPAG